MPTNIESLDNQLNKIDNLLQPLLESNRNNERSGDSGTEPTLYYSDAIAAMLLATKRQIESAIRLGGNGINNEVNQRTLRDFIRQINSKSAMYDKYKSPFYLVSISTTAFVERMRFSSLDSNAGNSQWEREEKELFETAKRLHVLRNIGVRIFIRNALTKLSFDMLVFTIPIITFAAIISAISNYGSYNTLYLRLLFAASMSTVALPFILLFLRTLPVLQLIRGSSSIPFAGEKQH